MSFLCYQTEPSYELGRRIVAGLKLDIGRVHMRRFPDGETLVRIDTPCRDRPTVVIAPMDRPDMRILPLLYLARTLRDEGADSVGLVSPYLPYMRQDRRFRTGEGLTSAYFADLVSEHFDWVMTVDPHLHRYDRLAEVYRIPAYSLHATRPIALWITEHVSSPLLVGPDVESTQWVSQIAELADAPFTVLEKTRFGDRDVAVSMVEIESLRSGTPVIIDDIISSGETLAETIRQLRARGATPPVCIATHALFADGATDRIKSAGADRIVSTNSVDHPTNRIDLSTVLIEAVRTKEGAIGS